MSVHLNRDLERLHQHVMSVGGLVETATGKAVRSLVERRPSLAEEVLAGDRLIDQREVEVEEECLKMLALHHPVAGDLRFLVAVLKLNNDLERMGDLAGNLAERAIYVATHDPLPVALDFEAMGNAVLEMQRKSLDAVIQRNPDLAREVMQLDDHVDQMNRNMYDALHPVLQEMPDAAVRAVHLLSCSRYLERIADHAENIAEDVIFMVDGNVIRHQHREQPA
jgi:phosphate transport system protein